LEAHPKKKEIINIVDFPEQKKDHHQATIVPNSKGNGIKVVPPSKMMAVKNRSMRSIRLT
jgi:hypothetical protein